MKQHGVEPVSPAADGRLADHRRSRNFPRAPLQVHEVALHMLVDAAEGRGKHIVESLAKLGDAAAAHGNGLNHRYAEFALEDLGIELEPVGRQIRERVERAVNAVWNA